MLGIYAPYNIFIIPGPLQYSGHCSTGTGVLFSTVPYYNLKGEATLAVSVAMSAAVRMPLALPQNKEEVLREVCIL